MKISGMSALRAELRAYEKKVELATKTAFLRVADLIANDAIRDSPPSVSIEVEQTETGVRVMASGREKEEIAAYIEFGTGPYVKTEPGYEDYAMTFFVNGKGTTTPHPFLFPAFFRHKDKIEQFINEELEKSE